MAAMPPTIAPAGNRAMKALLLATDQPEARRRLFESEMKR
jgi:hypothetical protein